MVVFFALFQGPDFAVPPLQSPKGMDIKQKSCAGWSIKIMGSLIDFIWLALTTNNNNIHRRISYLGYKQSTRRFCLLVGPSIE